MKEQGRRVRAHSNNTGRPYYNIDYRLSLTDRDFLGIFADGGIEVIEFDNGEETPPMPFALAESSTAMRRNSELTAADRGKLTVSCTELLHTPNGGPSTPSTQHRKKLNGNNPLMLFPSPKEEDSLPIHPPVRRIKSASTMQDLELNRSAPLHQFSPAANTVLDQNALPGFVTCLNSRNVGKYRVGQRYRDSVVVGIDDEHGKIIVYNENLPKGALTVLRTQNAGKYDRGYPLEDARGVLLGTVHALDRVQNLLVLNTANVIGDIGEDDVLTPSPVRVIKA